MEKLKVLDLFSGIGGFSVGLEKTGGFETVAFCDFDEPARKVLQKHWPNTPIFNDVKTLSAKDIDGTVDVICGGFPCQDISLAGKGVGLSGERSGLWFEFHRLIQEIKPKWVIAENVSALRSRGLDQVLSSLSEIGYDAEWHCIPASGIGAPHRRDRIWVVAYPRHGSWGRIGTTRQQQAPCRSGSCGTSRVFGHRWQTTSVASAWGDESSYGDGAPFRGSRAVFVLRLREWERPSLPVQACHFPLYKSANSRRLDRVP